MTWCIAVLAFSIQANPSLAQDDDSHYCGIYSAFAALRAIGQPIEMIDLCRSEFVGTVYGSTMEELCRAVTENGANAQPLVGLTAAALRGSPYPLVLHVRPAGLDSDFIHWIAFLGTDADGKARICDPPRGVMSIAYPDLVALWDGTGLAVSRTPITQIRIAASSWVEACWAFAVSLGLLFVARKACYARWTGLAAILFTATVMAIMWHVLFQDGFYKNESAVGLAFGHHADPVLATCSADELIASLGRPELVLIDCRFPNAFRAGHLPGAFNLPVSAGPAEHATFFSDIPRDRTIVVYCQSKECPWSKSVAASIYHRGYRYVSIYSGGWEDWIARSKN